MANTQKNCSKRTERMVNEGVSNSETKKNRNTMEWTRGGGASRNNKVLARALSRKSFAIASTHTPVVIGIKENHLVNGYIDKLENHFVEKHASSSVSNTGDAGEENDDQTEFLVQSVLSLSQFSQYKFLSKLCETLSFDSLLHIKNCAEELIKRDYISSLPPEIVQKILSFVDVKTQGRMSLVCKKWKSVLPAIWKTACQRVGIAVTSENESYWIARYRRSVWRMNSWLEDPNLSIVPVSSSFPGDQDTLCYIDAFEPTSHFGYIAASISPGMVVFNPESESGAATYFLRTGPAISPTVVRVFGQLAILGFGNGQVQQWDWKRNALLNEFQNASLSPVTSLDYSESWDLIAVGSEDSWLSIWRGGARELVTSFVETSAGSPGGAVRKVRFVERTLFTSLIETSDQHWSTGEQEEVHKLFVVALYEVQSVSFMFGSKRRNFCNMVVWEIEPYSGSFVGDVFIRNSIWDQEGLKDSLEVIKETGTVVYLTSYDFGSQPFLPLEEVALAIHEFDPIGQEEFVSSISYLPLSPLGTEAPEADVTGLREWQLLGIGRRFLALAVWELNRNEMSASTVSALLIYERVVVIPEVENASSVPETAETRWIRALVHTPSCLSADFAINQSYADAQVFGAFVLGSKSWLNGFDGENDAGLMYAGAYWDYLQGGWRVKSFSWREPGQGPYGYCSPVTVGGALH